MSLLSCLQHRREKKMTKTLRERSWAGSTPRISHQSDGFWPMNYGNFRGLTKGPIAQKNLEDFVAQNKK